jgi:hypothetical protein
MQCWGQDLFQDTWHWFSTLSKHEWMVLLAIVAALGFLCLRGFTQRGTL